MATITKKKFYQLDHIWETAIKMNGSVVLWRSPRENDKNLLIDLSSKISDSKTKIQASDMGFFISPFLNNSGENTFFLKADALFKSKNNKKWEPVIGERISDIDKSLKEYTLENRPPTYHTRDQSVDQISNEKIDILPPMVKFPAMVFYQ